MPIKSKENSLGAIAFLAGVILAVIVGIFTIIIPIDRISSFNAQIYGILVLLGIVVGFMNSGGKDSHTFLLAGTALVIVSGFGMDSVYGSLLGIGIVETVRTIFAALLVLFVPATIIVALKTVFSISNIS
jgi:uncharacterized membrane protein